MAGRQSKWQRSKNPERIFVQQRDKDIICAVYEFRYLSRDQIQKLFNFNCLSKVNLRLRKLYDNRYLSRIFLPVARGSSKAIYFLGNKGINIVTEQLGFDPLIVRKNQREASQVKDMFLNHHLNLNEIKIIISKDIHAHPDMKMERWINDHDCQQKYLLNDPGRKSKKVFRPDGYLRFWHKNKIYSFFVELDQSTMSHKRFKTKVIDYVDFARSGHYQRIFGVQYFRVLIVAPSVKRMLNLKETVEEVTDKIFWFSTFKKITSEGGFGPVWLRPGNKGPQSLIGGE